MIIILPAADRPGRERPRRRRPFGKSIIIISSSIIIISIIMTSIIISTSMIIIIIIITTTTTVIDRIITLLPSLLSLLLLLLSLLLLCQFWQKPILLANLDGGSISSRICQFSHITGDFNNTSRIERYSHMFRILYLYNSWHILSFVQGDFWFNRPPRIITLPLIS